MSATETTLAPMHVVPEQPGVWHLKTAHGWAEISLHDVADLASFLDQNPEGTLEALRAYEYGQMGERWRAQDPQTAEAQRAFYAGDDSYLYSLTLWQLRGPDKYTFYHDLVHQAATWQNPKNASRPLRALDYGSGIGTSALWLAELGYEVTVADIAGSPQLAYTIHRFGRRDLPVHVIAIDPKADVPNVGIEPYDLICAFDTLEHVPEVSAVTLNLLSHLRQPGGLFVCVAPFDEVEGAYAGPHLEENQRRFGSGHFELWLSGQGFARSPGGYLWWPARGRARLGRKLHYALYWTTGLDVRPRVPGWRRR